MTMYWLNGVVTGLVSSNAQPYAFGVGLARRMLWNWLVKVVGWTDVQKSGTKWDNPTLIGSDGVTDAADHRIFTSAAQTFTQAMEGYWLMIKSGCTDPTKHGFWRINRYVSDHVIMVEPLWGNDSVGLPLSQTGLGFEVLDLTSVSKVPTDGDYFVVGGAGIGGTFHLKCRISNTAVSYNGELWQLSPFDDWTAGAWKTPNRITSETALAHLPGADLAVTFAFADQNHLFLFQRTYNFTWSIQDTYLMYAGDFSAYDPTHDTRPVVLACTKLATWLDEIGTVAEFTACPKMVSPDYLVPISGYLMHPSINVDAYEHSLDSSIRHRSWHSGRFMGLPLVVVATAAGACGVRGELKDLRLGHLWGPRVCSPYGTGKTRFRLGTLSMPWNGSFQRRFMY